MEQITVVIGDRLGKGQKVAAGVEKAGGRAVVVPGVAADMKLGDVMKAENATFGISFCGSGGAGAITGRHEAGRCDESGKRHFRHFILRQRRRGRYHRAKQAWLQSQIWDAVSR